MKADELLGLYLCSKNHRLPGFNILYNDIEDLPGIDLCFDCRILLNSHHLFDYDYVIATPPCNYYSKANYRRETSIVAQSTKDLLPLCLEKLKRSNKPFLIENVLNMSLLPKCPDGIYFFKFGNHAFYTNVKFLVPDKCFAIRQNKQNLTRSKRDGNYNVDLIIKLFLSKVCETYIDLAL